jgi:arylsulfatase A
LQAVRFGDWKAVRQGPKKPIELYDLKTYDAEDHDFATSQPDLIAKAEALMKSSRTEHRDWPLVQKLAGKKKKL